MMDALLKASIDSRIEIARAGIDSGREIERERARPLVEALEPFAKFACDEPNECFNCRARAALAAYKEGK